MSYVYFIQAGRSKNVKIGYSRNHPSGRLKQLQTGSPQKLKLLFYVYGSRKDEKNLHKKFKQLQTRGEWFKLGEEILSFISTIKMLGAYPEPFPANSDSLSIKLPPEYQKYPDEERIGTGYGEIIRK